MSRGVRILVIEDEEEMRESLAGRLREDGYDVSACECGEKGVEAVKDRPFDLVLVDLEMPGIDGLETLRRIKALREGIPVILMNATAAVDTAVQAMKEGAFDYVVRPLRPEEIRARISNAARNLERLRENPHLRGGLENEPARMKRVPRPADVNRTLEDVENRHILRVLHAKDWNIQKSAQILGIDRSTLYRKIEKYDLGRMRDAPTPPPP
jgi:DNA-binding NtrC family response regulator